MHNVGKKYWPSNVFSLGENHPIAPTFNDVSEQTEATQGPMQLRQQ